jgi:bifunctional non-homologous end joining protein LigD
MVRSSIAGSTAALGARKATRTSLALPDAPVAPPFIWEMETIDKPSHFHIDDAKELLRRAGSRALASWGRAVQKLPDL